MSFLPAGFSTVDELSRHHQAQLDIYGTDATYLAIAGIGTPDEIPVRVIRVDPTELAAAASDLMAMAFVPASGLPGTPTKNDILMLDGTRYRMFDVQGPDAAQTLYLHLAKC